MRKFSKINESTLDKSDLDKIKDVLSDFQDDSRFTVTMNVKTNGHSYIGEMPDFVTNFNFIELTIWLKKKSNSDDFFNEVAFFIENIHNLISHLESIGKIFYKTRVDHNREYFNETDKEEKFTTKTCDVNIEAHIKIFPN